MESCVCVYVTVNASTICCGWQNVKSEIYAEYKKLQSDASYADDRRLCDYLHRKLSHIKHVVQEYDQSRLAK